jgi:hypothetical protein
MTEFKKTLCEEGKEFINKYNNEGDQVLVSRIVESLQIPIDEIVEFTQEKVRIGYDRRKISSIEENPNESQELSYYKLLTEIQDRKLKEVNKSCFDLKLI